MAFLEAGGACLPCLQAGLCTFLIMATFSTPAVWELLEFDPVRTAVAGNPVCLPSGYFMPICVHRCSCRQLGSGGQLQAPPTPLPL